MRKGITPVIAMILLILIVVALGGVFAAWTTRTWETLGERGEEQIETVTEQMQIAITIDSVLCTDTGRIYLRNMGGLDINPSDVTVYVNDTWVNTTFSGILSPGAVATIENNTVAADNDLKLEDAYIRVTVPGNTASYQCRTERT